MNFLPCFSPVRSLCFISFLKSLLFFRNKKFNIYEYKAPVFQEFCILKIVVFFNLLNLFVKLYGDSIGKLFANTELNELAANALSFGEVECLKYFFIVLRN